VLLPVLALAVWQPGWPGTLLGDHGIDVVCDLSMAISLLGLGLRCFTVGAVPGDSSGRNTREQRAAALNTTGMYSIVRHPLYVANGIMLAGFALATTSLWFMLLSLACFALFIERVAAAEEKFLQQTYGATYAHWVEQTPAFLPRPKLWRSSKLHYSIRTVLRREYNGFLGVTLAFFLLEALRDMAIAHESPQAWLADDGIWTVMLLLGVFVAATLRTLKRHTRWLRVRGR